MIKSLICAAALTFMSMTAASACVVDTRRVTPSSVRLRRAAPRPPPYAALTVAACVYGLPDPIPTCG